MDCDPLSVTEYAEEPPAAPNKAVSPLPLCQATLPELFDHELAVPQVPLPSIAVPLVAVVHVSTEATLVCVAAATGMTAPTIATAFQSLCLNRSSLPLDVR